MYNHEAEVNMQAEADRMIVQGLTDGSITLQSGRTIRLSESQIVQLLKMVKSTKLINAPALTSILVPSDFVIPTIEELNMEAQHKQSETEAQHQKDKVDKPKAIDFEELERQINLNTKPQQ